ncbi:MAG: ribonuclease HI family protein [Spirochaetota bacterium]
MKRIYIDGGSRGNPGQGAIGIVGFENNREIYRYGRKIGRCTNNYAEYTALIEALKYILGSKQSGLENQIIIYSDSELLVNQIRGTYRVKNQNIAPLYREAKELLEKLENVQIEHVRRENNCTADRIVNRVLDSKPYF